jgi:hypothetical protein
MTGIYVRACIERCTLCGCRMRMVGRDVTGGKGLVREEGICVSAVQRE